MTVLRRAIRAFGSEQQGISITEYGLLIAGIAVALVVVVSTAGAEIRNFVDRATCAVYERACAETTGDVTGGTGGKSSEQGSGANAGGGNNTGSNNNGGGNNTGSGR